MPRYTLSANLVLSRLNAEVNRLVSWADRAGTDKHKKIASELLKVVTHITPMFADAGPMPSKADLARLEAREAIELFKLTGKQKRNPYQATTNHSGYKAWIEEWAKFASNTFPNADNTSANSGE